MGIKALTLAPSTEPHRPINNLHGSMRDHVLFPDTSSTWTPALFALCFKLIALCRAAVMGGRGETEERMDSQ